MDSLAFWLAVIFLILMLIPKWLWIVIGSLFAIIMFFAYIYPLFKGGGGSQGYSGDYSSGGGSVSAEKSEWPFGEKVVIEGGKIRDKGVYGTEILSRGVGYTERQDALGQDGSVKIYIYKEGPLGDEEVLTVKGDTVYNKKGEAVADVKSTLLSGKKIIGKDGKELGEYND